MGKCKILEVLLLLTLTGIIPPIHPSAKATESPASSTTTYGIDPNHLFKTSTLDWSRLNASTPFWREQDLTYWINGHYPLSDPVYAEPGTKITLYFHTSNNTLPEPLTLDYRLVRIDGVETTLYEETEVKSGPSFGLVLQVDLPSDAPAKYMFGVTFTDADGYLVGSIVDSVNVVDVNLIRDVRVEVSSSGFSFLREYTLRLTNVGNMALGCDSDYDRLERGVNGSWVRVPIDRAVAGSVLKLEPDENRSIPLDFPCLSPGSYRVYERVDSFNPDVRGEVYAEFSVGFDYSIIVVILIIVFLVVIFLHRNRSTNKMESKPTYDPVIRSSNSS